MMAVFDTDKGGDALSKFYHETALILTQDEVALMLFARTGIPSIRPGPNPSVQRR